MSEVIIVCFGNVCRSPMGAALLQQALDRRLGDGHEVVVTSAGIGASDGYPPSQGSIRAMQNRGIDIRSHRSRLLTPDWSRRALLVYCMEDYQVERARGMAPDCADRIRTMGEDVPDPLGSGQIAYDAVAYKIETLIPGVVEEIVAALGDAPAPAPQL